MSSVQFDRVGDNVSVDLLGESIVRVVLKPGARMTADDGARARQELLALTGSKPSVVLLQITGVGSVTPEAVSVYSDAKTVRAFAILGSTPMDQDVVRGLLGHHKPACPTEYFTDLNSALHWLLQHIPA
ncbi:hypothetical protein [Arthrobacter sp. NPDC057013]|uniref:DUF7793 family protein n=1 Tax=Arthrobacter sp. NPDC057013 TaxID=3345999 RepID=UPI003634A4BD